MERGIVHGTKLCQDSHLLRHQRICGDIVDLLFCSPPCRGTKWRAARPSRCTHAMFEATFTLQGKFQSEAGAPGILNLPSSEVWKPNPPPPSPGSAEEARVRPVSGGRCRRR